MSNTSKLLFLMISCLLLPAAAAAQQGLGFGQFHGTSPAIKDLKPSQPQDAGQQTKPWFRPYGAPVGPAPAAPYDRVLQPSVTTPLSVTVGKNILGLGSGFAGFTASYAPPDTNAAVGTTQLVEAVNLSFAVFNKTSGALVKGPVALSKLFSNSTPVNNCQNGALSDPTVLFDKANHRWVITFLAATSGGPIGFKAPFYQCIAVSQTDDATGAYWLYSFDMTLGQGQLANTPCANAPCGFLNDYPKLGIRPDAYYMTFNEFDATTASSPFQGALVCAMQSSVMVSGGPNPAVVCKLLPTEDSLLPADWDTALVPTAPPPSGAVEALVGTLQTDNISTSSFNIVTFSVDFGTLSSVSTSTTMPNVGLFAEACGGGTCIVQRGTSHRLDSLGDRLMHRAAYRNLGVYESIVVSHSVAGSGTSTGVRWYEIRNLAITQSPPSWSIYQQGTYNPDANFRWMPSIAMDKQGNIAMGYSVSGTAIYPSIRFTGRNFTDPTGTMAAESSIVAGTNNQTLTSRWGDYASMSIDPSDDCTFWYAQEYIKNRSSFFSFNWSTRLASFRFSSCP